MPALCAARSPRARIHNIDVSQHWSWQTCVPEPCRCVWSPPILDGNVSKETSIERLKSLAATGFGSNEFTWSRCSSGVVLIAVFSADCPAVSAGVVSRTFLGPPELGAVRAGSQPLERRRDPPEGPNVSGHRLATDNWRDATLSAEDEGVDRPVVSAQVQPPLRRHSHQLVGHSQMRRATPRRLRVVASAPRR